MKSEIDVFEMTLSFQRGERKGFTYFYNELYPALLYFSHRIVKDKIIAEDLVENSFVKIWNCRQNFTHPKVIKSWLYTTVKNESLNYLVKETRTQNRLSQYEQHLSGHFQESADNEMIRAEAIWQIYATLQTLPSACKKIFQLMYVHGMTAKETAYELGLSISTIKNQKARGLKIIKKKLPDLSQLAAG